MRDQSDDDELMDAVLLELQIQVGIGEAAGAPVFRGHDFARTRHELGTNLTAPRAVFKTLVPPRCLLNRCDVLPGLVVPGR